jgi:hypothetical protein
MSTMEIETVDEFTVEQEIGELIAKQVREGLNDTEREQFLQLSAQRTMRKRPSQPNRMRLTRHRQIAA